MGSVVECGEEAELENENLIETFKYVCDGILVSLIGLVGVLGNVTSIVVLARPRLRDCFHRLLLALGNQNKLKSIKTLNDHKRMDHLPQSISFWSINLCNQSKVTNSTTSGFKYKGVRKSEFMADYFNRFYSPNLKYRKQFFTLLQTCINELGVTCRIHDNIF